MGLNPLPSKVRVMIAVWPWGTYLGDEGLLNGVKAKTSSWVRIGTNMIPTGTKACGVYINSSLATVEALNAGYDEAILLNEHGQVAEGSGENVFIVKDGVLLTPPLSAGVLRGITRDTVIEFARDLDIRSRRPTYCGRTSTWPTRRSTPARPPRSCRSGAATTARSGPPVR
jgi:branched-chain amino acid aminotransferase